jgi:hypothetical protein
VSRDEFLRAVRPIVEALGGTLVPERSARRGDLPIEWDGETIGYVRAPELHGALGRLVADVERELGAPISEMSRTDKQVAVRRLDERGAFLLRGAVDDVATSMGVSRVTLYTYLNAIGSAADESAT